MRVALNLEQLLQPAPGGIGRYTAELARLLPALPAGDGDEIRAAGAGEGRDNTRPARAQVGVGQKGVALEVGPDRRAAPPRREFELDDAPYVFWVGSLEPRKNVELLVDAFVRWALHTDLPHLLVLAGPAGWLEDETSVLEPARRLGNRVRTLGRVGDPALGALYRGADLFAFPSRHEGFGIPVLEAMAQETPVLAADIPALREIAAGAPLLPSPADPHAWVAALDNLPHDQAELSRWRRLGRSRAQGYSWARCAEETRAIYLEAVGA